MGGAAGLIGEGAKLAIGTSASQQAAQAEAAGLQRGQDVQMAMYKRNMAESAPWRAAGQAALAELSSIYGLPSYGELTGGRGGYGGKSITYNRGKTGFEKMEEDLGFDKLKKTQLPGISKGLPLISEFTDSGIKFSPVDVGGAMRVDYTPSGGSEAGFEKFASLPQYQFQLQEAEKAANRAAAARGGYGGGAQMRALQDIAQGTAAQGFGDYVSGLANIAGLGQGFTSQGMQMGANLGSNLANTFAGQGAAAGQASIDQANIMGQGIGGVTQWLGQQQGQQSAPFGGYGFQPSQSPQLSYGGDPYGMMNYSGNVGIA